LSINFDLLKRLSETPGVPGHEDRVRALVVEELKALADDVKVDGLGNVIATKRGNGQGRVMIAAHMDEIGFMVLHVDDDGFIKINPFGGFDPRVLLAQRVLVHGFAGESLRGVLSTAAKPIHLLRPDEIKPPRIEEYFVDTGVSGARVKELVEIGDMVTLDRTAENLGDRVIGKAMDDRVGLLVMIEALRKLKASGKHEADVVAVATTQEEVGLRGAGTSAYHVEPTIGVALDVTLALDIPGTGKGEQVTRLGAGAAIGLANSSLISHPKLVKHVRQIAKEREIPHQMEILPRGGTDAAAIQRSRGGVPSITLSVPTRYIHTVNEMVDTRDVQAAIDLLAAYLEQAHTGSYQY
jgi:putative aminopeptidase FrvX